MKQIIAITLALAAATSLAADTQKICIDKIGKDGKVVVGKDGKAQQDCKMMKVHKKLEGTQVPPKK